jgi:SNF2 family DNA or RNA helicase
MIRRLPPNLTPRTKPLAHQLEAIEFVRKRNEVALFDEQGLGKTKIVLDAILADIADGIIDGALVVCRNGLLPTWRNEILIHTNVRGIVLAGSRGQAASHYVVPSPFYLTSYSILHRELPNLRKLLELRKMAMVLDESHAIKNPKARATADVLALAPLATKRIILTGTPVANYPEDLWSQFMFLDGGSSLGQDFETFRFDMDLGRGAGRSRVSAKTLTRIASAIRPISIRRTKQGVLELPEKVYSTETVALRGPQLRMYNQVRDQLRFEILGTGSRPQVVEIDNVLEKLLRLVQVASNPALLSPEFQEVPAKFRLLGKLLAAALKRGEKAVVWSQFVDNVRVLKSHYKGAGSLAIHGAVPIEERQRFVDLLQTDPRHRILFAVPGAAREGLTLTAANNAFYLDRGFNLVDYLQSQDRIHRIGQDKRCNIVTLEARGTIDQFVDTVLARKWEIARAVQSGVEPKLRTPIMAERELRNVLGGSVDAGT